MYIVNIYKTDDTTAIEAAFNVEDLVRAKKMADAVFEATKQTVKVLDDSFPFDNAVYTRITPEAAFNSALPMVRERALMETAMRIMDIYGEMVYSQHLNPDKLDSMDYMEKLQLFTVWALEYEEEFYGTKDYKDCYLEHSQKVFTTRLKEEFASEN